MCKKNFLIIFFIITGNICYGMDFPDPCANCREILGQNDVLVKKNQFLDQQNTTLSSKNAHLTEKIQKLGQQDNIKKESFDDQDMKKEGLVYCEKCLEYTIKIDELEINLKELKITNATLEKEMKEFPHIEENHFISKNKAKIFKNVIPEVVVNNTVNQKDDTTAELLSMRQEKLDLDEEIKKLDVLNKSLNKEKIQLKEQYKITINELHSQIKQLTNELHEIQQEKLDLDKEIKLLNILNKNLEAERTEITEQYKININELQSKIKQLTDELHEIQQRKTQPTKVEDNYFCFELSQNDDDVSIKLKEKEPLKNALFDDIKNSENEQLQKEKDILNEQIKSLGEQLNQIKNEYNIENEKLKEETNALKKKIEELTEIILDLNELTAVQDKKLLFSEKNQETNFEYEKLQLHKKVIEQNETLEYTGSEIKKRNEIIAENVEIIKRLKSQLSQLNKLNRIEKRALTIKFNELIKKTEAMKKEKEEINNKLQGIKLKDTKTKLTINQWTSTIFFVLICYLLYINRATIKFY